MDEKAVAVDVSRRVAEDSDKCNAGRGGDGHGFRLYVHNVQNAGT